MLHWKGFECIFDVGLTISPGMPCGPWKKEQISFSESDLNEINFTQVSVRIHFYLVTRWPAEPGGPLLPGRPGNPGTPSVAGGPCHIKTLWSVLENIITDIHSKATHTYSHSTVVRLDTVKMDYLAGITCIFLLFIYSVLLYWGSINVVKVNATSL